MVHGGFQFGVYARGRWGWWWRAVEHGVVGDAVSPVDEAVDQAQVSCCYMISLRVKRLRGVCCLPQLLLPVCGLTFVMAGGCSVCSGGDDGRGDGPAFWCEFAWK